MTSTITDLHHRQREVLKRHTKGSHRLLKILLSLAIAFGCVIRLVNIDRMYMWNDEAATSLCVSSGNVLSLYTSCLSKVIHPIDLEKSFLNVDQVQLGPLLNNIRLTNCNHPPLYFCLAAVWAHQFGNTMLSLRSLSTLFGLIEIPLVGWMCFELFGSSLAALVAAALVAVSPFFFLYSHEAREYSLWTCTLSLSVIFLARALKCQTRTNWFLYGLSQVLSLLTFYGSMLVLGLQACFLLWYGKGALKNFILANTPALCLVACWVAYVGPSVIIDPSLSNWPPNWVGKALPLTFMPPLSPLLNIRLHLVLLTNVFFDLGQPAPKLLIRTLALLILGSICLFLRCKRGLGWLMSSLTLGYVGIFIAANLILGEQRGFIIRYSVPSLLALEVIVAQVLTAEINSLSQWRRILSLCVVNVVIALGVISCLWLSRATTHQVKPIDIQAVARRMNGNEKSLLIGADPFNILVLKQFVNRQANFEIVKLGQSVSIPNEVNEIIIDDASDQIKENAIFKTWHGEPLDRYTDFTRSKPP